MVALKTGVLLRMSAVMTGIKLGLKSTIIDKLGNFATMLGVVFQIQDDILNLTGNFIKNKGYNGEDITEVLKNNYIFYHINRKAIV